MNWIKSISRLFPSLFKVIAHPVLAALLYTRFRLEWRGLLMGTGLPEVKIWYASPYYLETLGYTLEELKNMDIHEIVHPDDRERTLQKSHSTMTSGQKVYRMVNFKNRYIKKDGTIINCTWNGIMLFGWFISECDFDE